MEELDLVSYRLWYENNTKEILTVNEAKPGHKKYLETKTEVDCYDCFKNNTYECKTCSIFDSDYFKNFNANVLWFTYSIMGIVSPFLIIPRQSHLNNKTISEHTISKMFYRFKSGNKYYSRVFAYGIIKAIEKNSHFNSYKFDYILGIPLSPEKIENNELDRVSELCKIVSQEVDVCYLENALTLKKPISRRDYKLLGKSKNFSRDYYNYLQLEAPDLSNKRILVIDDVITDCVTFYTAARRIDDAFPLSRIYAAAGGIMAKKSNMKMRGEKW